METDNFLEYTEAFNQAWEDSLSDIPGPITYSLILNEEKQSYSSIFGEPPARIDNDSFGEESNLGEVLENKIIYGRNIPSQESKNLAQQRLKNTKINITDDSLFLKPSAITEENLKLVREGRQDEITVDRDWIKASKLLHNFLKPNEAPYDSDEEYAKWGIDFTNALNYSISDLVVNVNKMDDAPPQLFHAMYYLLETSDRQGISLKNFTRGVYEIATDPVDQLSVLSGFGIGFLFKEVGRQVTKRTLKEKLKDIIVRKPNATDLVLSAEGAGIVGEDSVARQTVREGAGGEKVSNLETGASALAGATLLPLGGRTVEGITESVLTGLKKLKPKKDTDPFIENFKKQLDLFVEDKSEQDVQG